MKIREVSAAHRAVLLLLSVIVALAMGCVGEETYADKHLADIRFDCQQTAQCDPVFNSTNMDPVSECIEDTGAKLNSMGEMFRTTYEGRVARCKNYNGCAYFACAQDDELFSLLNGGLIANECQQAVACKQETGMPVGPNDAMTCIAELSESLDFAMVADRSGWAQRATRCQPQAGCAYVTCP